MNDIKRARFIRKIADAVPDLMKSAMQGTYWTETTLGVRRMADNSLIKLKLIAVRERPPGVKAKPDVGPAERLVENTSSSAGDDCA